MADATIACLVLTITAPLLVVVAIALRATVGSPVLFHQVRGGTRGKSFVTVKFRTMREACIAGRLLPDEERTPWFGDLFVAPGWTSCRSSGTCSSATWRWLGRGRW